MSRAWQVFVVMDVSMVLAYLIGRIDGRRKERARASAVPSPETGET